MHDPPSVFAGGSTKTTFTGEVAAGFCAGDDASAVGVAVATDATDATDDEAPCTAASAVLAGGSGCVASFWHPITVTRAIARNEFIAPTIRDQNVGMGLASSASMSAVTCAESGSMGESYRATTSPCRDSRNLLKFHVMSNPASSCVDACVLSHV